MHYTGRQVDIIEITIDRSTRAFDRKIQEASDFTHDLGEK